MNNPNAQPLGTGDDRVRLIASARFFTATASLPRGIRGRDLRPMIGGLIEEHSPLPLAQTAWGFLVESRRKGEGSILYFAAPRNLVFGEEESKPETDSTPVVPAFAALQGCRVKEPTWIFLADDEGVAALLFHPGSAVPTRIVSRFAEETPVDSERLWQVRDELANDLLNGQTAEEPSAKTLDGLLRAKGRTGKKGRGINFEIEHQEAPDAPWKPWRKSEIKTPLQVLGADLRDHEQLETSHRANQSTQRILVTVSVFALAVAGLTALEFLQIRRNREATQLRAQVDAREPDVERLKEVETMYKALDEIFAEEFIPFDWLMVVNSHRPREVAFSSYGIESGADMTIQGQSREVGFINAFAENLGKDPRFDSVLLSDVQTGRDGATFQVRIALGDITAKPSEDVSEEASGGEEMAEAGSEKEGS